MPFVLLALFVVGAYPLARAWWANRDTSLLHAINWALAAWMAWALAVLVEPAVGRLDPARYLALCLTGCTSIAVLGARRPHVGAWNFVVLGLLAVMLLPLLEGLLPGAASLDWLRIGFLAATLAIGVLNYLPTRLAPAMLLVAVGGTGAMLFLFAPATFPPDWRSACELCLALAPWAGYAGWLRQPPPANDVDRVWLDFRNRFGVLWAQRVREQFNRAAVNAGWPIFLTWWGLRQLVVSGTDPIDNDKILRTLQALLTRFGPTDEKG